MKNKHGFTLLEIIVVIIILGVLAALALPRLFSNIEFSRSAEALNTIGVIRESVERCATVSWEGYTGCYDWVNLDVNNPSTAAGSHFDYTVQINTIPEGNFQVIATRNALNGGDGVSSIVFTIWHNYVSGGGLIIQKAGTGVFSSIR